MPIAFGKGIGMPWQGGGRQSNAAVSSGGRPSLFPTDGAPPPGPNPPGPGGNKPPGGIEFITVPLNTVTGLQDIKIGGFGTPVAAMFYMNQKTVLNAQEGHGILSTGATDGTNQWTIAGVDTTGVGTTITGRWASAIHVMGIQSATADTNVHTSAKFVEFINDGVRINVDRAAAVLPYLLTVVLFGGEDIVAAKVDVVNLAAEDLAVTITPGFETNVLFTATHFNEFDDADDPTLIRSCGMASYDGSTIRQASQSLRSVDAVTAGDPKLEVRAAVINLPADQFVTLQDITAT